MGRFGQPEEIAAVVELLVTNSYMTNKVCTKCSDTRPSESLRSNSLAFCNKTRIRIADSKIVSADGGMLPSTLA